MHTPGRTCAFNADEKAIPNIVDRLEALFERKGHGGFEKWKVARIIADGIMVGPSKGSERDPRRVVKIAVGLNKLVTANVLTPL